MPSLKCFREFKIRFHTSKHSFKATTGQNHDNPTDNSSNLATTARKAATTAQLYSLTYTRIYKYID